MTIGINPEDCEEFEKLAKLHEVEATAVGEFTDSGAFVVHYGDETVAHLPISFLHDGCPQLQLESEWQKPKHRPIIFPSTDAVEMGKILSRLMARPNVASKEWWVRSYDHKKKRGRKLKLLILSTILIGSGLGIAHYLEYIDIKEYYDNLLDFFN